MMKTMRNNMKGILWILVIAFIATIIFSWGMGGFKSRGPEQGIAAVISGTKISTDRLENLFQQRLQAVQEQNKDKGTEVTEEQTKQIRGQVWDELVRDILIEKEVARRGLKATDQEIAYLIQNSPPDFIRSNEYFQTDGQFDPKKYEQFLHNPQAAKDLMMIEDSYRKSLPNQKFINELLSMAAVSDQEAWQSFKDENLKGRARYVAFMSDTIAIDTTLITAKMIEDYYSAHKEDYRVKEKRRVLYVMFKEQPSAGDSANSMHQLEELKTRLDQGEDFATLAKENSEDNSATNGGDMGFLGRGQMVKEFEEAVFSAPLGQVVGPFKTEFGYHLIKVTEQKTENGQEQRRVSHILIKFQASSDTKEMVRSAADGFAEEARKADFYAAARTYEAKVDTSDFFEKGAFISQLGRLPGAVDFIFARPVGQVSGVYNVRDGLVVFKTLEVQREHLLSLPEVRSGVHYALVEKMKKDKAHDRGVQFRHSVTDPTQFPAQAQAMGLQVQETDREFKVADYLPNLGRDPVFTAAALSLNLGEVSPAVDGGRGCYVIQLTDKTSPDSTQFQAQRDEIVRKLMTTKQNQIYANWLENAKKQAKIEDYRYLYYREY
jgi:peptidyl-prolyl cis-trans isomerase D